MARYIRKFFMLCLWRADSCYTTSGPTFASSSRYLCEYAMHPGCRGRGMKGMRAAPFLSRISQRSKSTRKGSRPRPLCVLFLLPSTLVRKVLVWLGAVEMHK